MGNCIRASRFRWPNGTVPFLFDSDIDSAEKQTIQSAMDMWTNSGAPVSFAPYTGPTGVFAVEPYVLFVKGTSGTSCSSPVGRRFPGQRVVCQLGPSTVAHEIGHALGLLHEHQRFDRDLHVSILLDNVQGSKKHNFSRVGIDDAIAVGPYDFNSRMHYPEQGFAVDFEVNLDIQRMSTRVAPSVAFFGSELHVVFTNDERDLFHAWTTDLGLFDWSDKTRIAGQSTKASASLAEFNGRLFLVHIGKTSNDVFISRSSTDGRTFQSNVKIPGVTSRNVPALAVHQGKLHMAMIGATDNEIRVCSSSTGRADDWTTPKPIDQTSKAGPGLVSDGTLLHLVHVGNSSDELWYSTSSDGTPGNWTKNEKIGQQSKITPALSFAPTLNGVHIAHLGESSNQIWHATLGASGKFGANAETNQFARQQPSLAAGRLGGTDVVVLAHIGDESNRIFVSKYNSSLRAIRRLGTTGSLGGSNLTAGDIAAVTFMYT